VRELTDTVGLAARVFYHQTTPDKAFRILSEGFVDEPTLSPELARYAGGDRRCGVWLTDRPLAALDGQEVTENATLVVSLDPAVGMSADADDFAALLSLQLGSPTRGYHQWLVPAEMLNTRARVVLALADERAEGR
jgi:hypothetical protein